MKIFPSRLLSVIAAILILSGCLSHFKKETPRIRYRQSRLNFGTVVHADICALAEDSQALDKAYSRIWRRMEEIYLTTSVDYNGSDVQNINFANLKPVNVHKSTYELIDAAIKYNRLTRGAFDITVLNLIYLWRTAEWQNTWPSHDEVAEHKKYVGSNFIRMLEGNNVQLLYPQTDIDLGGIAKGYAIDEAARIIREEGFDDFCVQAGSDFYCGGVNCDNKPWRIVISHPLQSKRLVDSVILRDSAISITKAYERYYIIQGQHWSHIINPITGYPQEGCAGAAVIAPQATMANALSAALCVLPVSDGINIIDGLGDKFTALVIRETPASKLVYMRSKSYPKFRYIGNAFFRSMIK